MQDGVPTLIHLWVKYHREYSYAIQLWLVPPYAFHKNVIFFIICVQRCLRIIDNLYLEKPYQYMNTCANFGMTMSLNLFYSDIGWP